MIKNKLGKNGFISLFDALLSILLIFVILIAFNFISTMDIPSLSEQSRDIKTAQDVMELMSMDLDGKDYSIIEEISYTLNKSKNSKVSQSEVSNKLKLFLDQYFTGFNYSFVENNQLSGKELISSGDKFDASNLTVASRNYGNYSYTIYVW